MDWHGTSVLPSLGTTGGLGEPRTHRGLLNRNPALAPIAAPPLGNLPGNSLEGQARVRHERSSASSGGQQLHIGKLPLGSHTQHHAAAAPLEPASAPHTRHVAKPVSQDAQQNGPPPQSARSIRSSGGVRDVYRSGALTQRPTSKGNWDLPNHGGLGGLGNVQGSLQTERENRERQREQEKEKEREKEREKAKSQAQLQPTDLPLTPGKVLKHYLDKLTEFEQGEIFDFPQVWFFGQAASKVRGTAATVCNHGYDDERGDYLIVLHDHILYRYEVTNPLGKGSFGQVVRCLDHKLNSYTAVKMIRNKKRFHHQALVEVKILEHLKEFDSEFASNVVHMSDYFYFRNHLCITFELLSINLYEFIKNNNFQGISLCLIRRFAVQLLTSLRFLRKQRIIHCDFKPENILLKNPTKSGIKVIDFGSSCFEDERVYTYIQSRFYRSPEVILGVPYDTAIDMWSFACILAELCTGYPLFPGENEVEQLACIMEVCGVPPTKLMENATRVKMFFDSSGNPRLVANSRGKMRRPDSKQLQTVLRTTDAKFVDFLEGCLRFSPKDRLIPEDALHHEWIMEGHARRAVDNGHTQPVSARRGSGRSQGQGSARGHGHAQAQANHQSHAQHHAPTAGNTGTASNGFAFPPIDTSAQMAQTQPKGFRTAGFSTKKVSAPLSSDGFAPPGPSHPAAPSVPGGGLILGSLSGGAGLSSRVAGGLAGLGDLSSRAQEHRLPQSTTNSAQVTATAGGCNASERM